MANPLYLRALLLAFALSSVSSAGPALAQTAKPAAATWTVQKPQSQLQFKATASGTAFTGMFRTWDAAIRFDPANLGASAVTVTINLASAATGDADRDQMLPSADWFNVKAFPRAVFAARSFRHLGGPRYQAVGTLTLRNVTRPLTLPFTLTISGNTAKMVGSATIDRNAFGVGQGQWSDDSTVGRNVNILVNLTARRAG